MAQEHHPGSLPLIKHLDYRMLIQIYEIQDPSEAREVSDAGVDHVGVLVGTGAFPREVSVENAREILRAIPEKSQRVVLTLSRDLEEVEAIAARLQPDILHLGTIPEALSPEHIKDLKGKFPRIRMMRSIPIIGEAAITLAKQLDGVADFLLLDSHKPDDNQVGATGLVHDWSISRRIVESVKTPVILAGGLGPENVTKAIQQVHPAGVDSKTRTDQPGTHRKDLEKVRRFVTCAKSQ